MTPEVDLLPPHVQAYTCTTHTCVSAHINIHSLPPSFPPKIFIVSWETGPYLPDGYDEFLPVHSTSFETPIMSPLSSCMALRERSEMWLSYSFPFHPKGMCPKSFSRGLMLKTVSICGSLNIIGPHKLIRSGFVGVGVAL